ncbi:unnamed protein product [Malus baccata var. baccata]
MAEGEAGGFTEGLLWENQSWANLYFNSDNSGGGGDEEKNLGKEQETAVMEISAEGHNQEKTVPPPPAAGKKRKGGGGGVGKNVKAKGKGSTRTGDKGKGVAGGNESDDHEMHILTERERRKKMRNMFANLHTLLPQLPAKADKSTIVDEAVSYVKTLQQTLQKLQKQKLERLQGVTTINLDLDPSINTQDVAFSSREAFLANHGSSNLATASTTPTSNPSNSFSASHFASISFQTWTSPNVVANICGEEAHISVCTPKKPSLFTAICFLLEKYNIGVISAQITSDSNRSMYMIHTHARGAPDQFFEVFPAVEIFRQAVAEIMLVVEGC